jgi:hypothetical protein
MTLGEELRRKYALTSLKAKGATLALLAINETLDAAAEIAEQEHAPIIAARIRSLKWADDKMAPGSVHRSVPVSKSA